LLQKILVSHAERHPELAPEFRNQVPQPSAGPTNPLLADGGLSAGVLSGVVDAMPPAFLSLSAKTKGKEKNSERRRRNVTEAVREERIFMNIIMDWVSTVTPNVLGVIVDSHPNYLNIGHLLERFFFVFFMKFSLNIGKGTNIERLMGVL
jgi:hypothetical protein